jgi:gliding motility-associated-like protein
LTYKLSILFVIASLFTLSSFAQTIEFVENRGQWDSRVKYMGKVDAGAFFVEEGGFTVVQHSPEDWGKITEAMHGHGADAKARFPQGQTLRSHAFQVKFLGGNPAPQIIADKPLPTYNNYFIGSDPSKWGANCKIYQGITVKNIYPNIDVRYYSGGGSVKYDLIVHPGGDPSRIALKYEGADGLEVKNKELLIKTSVGELRETDPYTYQYNEKGRVNVQTKYVVNKGNIVTFDIKAYNPKTTLVIDPNLVFCSFSGSSADNWGFTATYGPDGAMFGGGITWAQGFPVSPGAFQQSMNGGEWDMSIIKLTPDGTNRVYATYIGGSGQDQPHSLVVDNQGNLVIAGRSNSPRAGGSTYPVQGPLGYIGPANGGSDFDIVITKLNATGTALIGSVRIGGKKDDGVNISTSRSSNSLQQNYGDDGRSEVILDATGNIYVASCTQSVSSTGDELFPLRNPFQPTGGGGQDGVLLKFDPNLSTYLFGSFIGGSANDAAYVLAINPIDGNVYVAGGTESTNLLNGTRAGSLGSSNFGGIDGFVTIVTPNGSTVVKTSYIGTAGDDQVYGVQFDANGFPYVMGQTTGNWQAINAVWNQPNGKQFISKLRPDLSNFVYSTMFGKGDASPDISPVAFLVDRCENVYISGWGGRIPSTNYRNAGANGLPVTGDALKQSPDINPQTGMGDDFYFFVLKRDATAQLYGSYFGQNGGQYGDHVDGGTSRFDRRGVIYQAMCASCSNNLPFPTTAGAWSTSKPTQACNLAMVKIAFNLDGVQGSVRSSVKGVPRRTSGCVPLTVDFLDTIQEAKEYEWNFMDGSPVETTTTPNIQHTFNQVGTYRVMMIAIDPDKCITRDTSYVSIRVGDNEARLDFNPVKLSPPCDIFRYRFDNTSIAPAGLPFKTGAFTWDFGDNSPVVKAGPEAVFHTYAAPGTYLVKLIISDTAYCNSPDTLVKTLRVAANVKAAFETPATGCAPYTAVFDNISQGGAEFIWDFGDGTASTEQNPTHTYLQPGTYTVNLTANDPNTCNLTDATSFTITVYGNPTADFTAAPQPPITNTPITFTNLASSDAVRFKWLFGDGDSLETTSRGPVKHEYNLTGTYDACLIAYNAAGCPAQVCKQVTTQVEPAVDVPTAFTPLSNDINSYVFVRGYGIAKLKFSIYARWGEKVFESNDKKIGWDGRYKGKLLPMDVYAYTLDVEFVDGKKHQKKGDITLIR